MRVIYNSVFTDAVLPDVVALAGAAEKDYAYTHAATGWALLETTLPAGSTVEASDNDFVDTIYSKTLSVTGEHLEAIGSSKQAAAWRITAGAGGGTVGTFYIGTILTLRNPIKPYSFDQAIVRDDRWTIGGIGYSKIRHTRRRGNWQLENIPDDDISDWSDWYAATQGWRQGAILEEVLTSGLFMVRAPVDDFPMRRTLGENYSGSINVEQIT